VIFIAGMTIAVFFEFLLIAKKDKSVADRILAVWMFLITAHLFLFYLFFTGNIYEFPFLLGTGFPFPLLHGVFLYLYVGSVTGQLPANRNLLVLHFLPAGAMYLYLAGFFLLPAEQKIFVFKNQGAGYETFNSIRSVAVNLSGVVYVTWCLLLLRRHRRHILDLFSYRSKIDLQWLRILVWGLGGIWALVLGFSDDTIIFAGVTVWVFLIGFFGIRQVNIFSPEHRPVPDQGHGQTAGQGQPPGLRPTPGLQIEIPSAPAIAIETAEPAGKEKYAKSGLSKEMGDRLYTGVLRLMKEDTLYKKNDLTLDDLAARLDAHPNYLSQVINEQEGKNFYDFVNSYRLEEFKRLLSDQKNRHLTLLALAFECGFNSKSSFNRHFKKVTGQTPSEYFSSVTAH